jgi:hypothetical protein
MAMKWSSLLALSILLTSPATAQNINSDLCETTSKNSIGRILSRAPTKELVKYVEGLKKGSCAFNYTISGHDAAGQLGFGNRFAVTYSQTVEEVEARFNRNRSVNIDEIIEYFSRILGEEQFIDRLIVERERHFPALVYLRALQEGTCSFPYVLRDTPTGQAMMNQMVRACPRSGKALRANLS